MHTCASSFDNAHNTECPFHLFHLYTLYAIIIIIIMVLITILSYAVCVCVCMNATTIMTKASASASLLKDLLLAAEEGSLQKVRSFLDGGRCRVNDEDEVCTNIRAVN